MCTVGIYVEHRDLISHVNVLVTLDLYVMGIENNGMNVVIQTKKEMCGQLQKVTSIF